MHRRIVAVLALLLPTVAIVPVSATSQHGTYEDVHATKLITHGVPSENPKVLIELFVMSRCPDARRAEARFADVLAAAYSIAEIRTLYIADEAKNGSVLCKHGPLECAGDAQQLCAARYGRPPGAEQPDLGWLFLTCQNAQFSDVGSQDLAEECLQAIGFPGAWADSVRDCWSGREGPQLLRASARESHRRGVVKSCTVYIGGEYRCTHDDATWYDCPGGSEVADFVYTICDQYEKLTGRWPSEICSSSSRSGSQERSTAVGAELLQEAALAKATATQQQH